VKESWHTCDIIHFCAMSHICASRDITHAHLCHALVTRDEVSWRIHTGIQVLLPSHVRHDSFTCVPWLLHMCAMTSPHVWQDPSACAPWLRCICVMTHARCNTGVAADLARRICKKRAATHCRTHKVDMTQCIRDLHSQAFVTCTHKHSWLAPTLHSQGRHACSHSLVDMTQCIRDLHSHAFVTCTHITLTR